MTISFAAYPLIGCFHISCSRLILALREHPFGLMRSLMLIEFTGNSKRGTDQFTSQESFQKLFHSDFRSIFLWTVAAKS